MLCPMVTIIAMTCAVVGHCTGHCCPTPSLRLVTCGVATEASAVTKRHRSLLFSAERHCSDHTQLAAVTCAVTRRCRPQLSNTEHHASMTCAVICAVSKWHRPLLSRTEHHCIDLYTGCSGLCSDQQAQTTAVQC